MSLRSLITTLARDKGIEIDDDELDGLGLSNDEDLADNWVTRAGGLPKYIKRISNHLQEAGMTESHAIAVAVNAVKKICSTGDTNLPGKQSVNAKSRAQACAAVAEWEAKKASTKMAEALGDNDGKTLRLLASGDLSLADQETLAGIDLGRLAEDLDPDKVDLGHPLPGRAAGEIEIFLAAGSTDVVPMDDGDLLWEPIAREGQWAVRPDGRGGKAKIPLKIIAGRSKDQRREIGLQDVVDAFDDGAIEHVTIPETHENKATENHGYIEAVKIVKGKVKDSGKDKIVSVLMGGYNFLDAKTKEKAKKGLIPSRSAGFLYDYQRTDSAKVYPVALEHVALTSKPWLRGMPRFGRKLMAASDSDMQTVPLTLSDEGPTDDEYVLILAESNKADDFLAEPTVTWSHEDDPKWLQQQVNDILRATRNEKLMSRKNNPTPYYVEERVPHYRCSSAKPGSALISDNWDDDSNFWVAGITVKDGAVEIDDFTQWKATKKVWVPDEREAPKGDKAPLSDVEIVTEAPEQVIEPLKLAQMMRLQRSIKLADAAPPASPISSIKQDDPPRGGGLMADEGGTLQLSEEARALIKAAEDAAAAAKAEAAQAKADNLKLAETVDRLVGTANGNEADAFIKGLKSLGLDEEHGYGGMLVELHAVLLHDDHGPAIQAEHFADDRNKEGVLSVTGAFKRVFGALKAGQDGKLALGEVVKPPSEKRDDEPGGGKPSKGDAEVDESNLSDDELLADEDPIFAQRLGYQPVGAKSNGSKKDGE